MAINKRAEIQLNGIKSGIPVSPTTPHHLPKPAPVYKCPCASISPHQHRTVQSRPNQNRTAAWNGHDSLPTPPPLPPYYRPHASSIELPLCEGRLEIEDSGLWWGWANITIASRQQKPALATPQLIDTSYDTHTHCKKSKLNKSRRWCLITSNKINSSTLWFPTANSCKDYKTGFTSVFNVRWGCYLELRSI